MHSARRSIVLSLMVFLLAGSLRAAGDGEEASLHHLPEPIRSSALVAEAESQFTASVRAAQATIDAELAELAEKRRLEQASKSTGIRSVQRRFLTEFRHHFGGAKHLATFGGMAYLFALAQVVHLQPQLETETQLTRAAEVAFGPHALEAIAAFLAAEKGIEGMAKLLEQSAPSLKLAGITSARAIFLNAGKVLSRAALPGAMAVVHGLGNFQTVKSLDQKRSNSICQAGVSSERCALYETYLRRSQGDFLLEAFNPDRLDYWKVLTEGVAFVAGSATAGTVTANPYVGFSAGITASIGAASYYESLKLELSDETSIYQQVQEPIQDFLRQEIVASGTPEENASAIGEFFQTSLTATDTLLILQRKGSGVTFEAWQELMRDLLEFALIAMGKSEYYGRRDDLLMQRFRTVGWNHRTRGAFCRRFNQFPLTIRISRYPGRTEEQDAFQKSQRGSSSFQDSLDLAGDSGVWWDLKNQLDPQDMLSGSSLVVALLEEVNRAFESMHDSSLRKPFRLPGKLDGTRIGNLLRRLWLGMLLTREASTSLDLVTLHRREMVEAGGQGAGLPAQMPELLEDYLVRIEDEVTEARVAQASLGAWISSFRLEATTVLNLARTTWGTYLAFVRGEEGPGLSEVPSFEGVFR